MDITETIRTIRTLITQERPDKLDELMDTLIDYFDTNIDTLNDNKSLKQQIADCFLLAGKQKLARLPEKCNSYLWLAYAGFLNGDIGELCQNMVTFIDRDAKRGGQAWDSNEMSFFILPFLDNLTPCDRPKFRLSVQNALDKNYPESAAAYHIRALDETLTEDERFVFASKAVEADKTFIQALYWLAIYYMNTKNWKNAIVYFNKCFDLGATHAHNFFDVAVCYSKIKDTVNEITAYINCVEADPNFPFAMNNLGYAYEKSKDYDRALSCYKKSIKSGNDETYPYRNTFRLLKRLKRYDEMIAFWETNKKRLPLSFQNDVDKLRETKSNDIQQVIPDSIEDENDAIPDTSTVKRSSIQGKSFLAESRLEDEIEAQIDRGIPFCGLPLKMYDNSDGYGRQYVIPGIGRIDILAVNTSSNDLYVIELKKGLGDDEVIGQVSRYMGWVKENLASSGQSVYGIVCVAQASEKLKYAAAAHQNITVFNYSLQITPA